MQGRGKLPGKSAGWANHTFVKGADRINQAGRITWRLYHLEITLMACPVSFCSTGASKQRVHGSMPAVPWCYPTLLHFPSRHHCQCNRLKGFSS
eukprot:1154054-Pelagomonas_calceolata.AAC.8